MPLFWVAKTRWNKSHLGVGWVVRWTWKLTIIYHGGRAASALLSSSELANLACAVTLPGAWGREKDTEEGEVVDGASRRRLMGQEMEITENLRRQTQNEGAGRKWQWRLLLNISFAVHGFLQWTAGTCLQPTFLAHFPYIFVQPKFTQQLLILSKFEVCCQQTQQRLEY